MIARVKLHTPLPTHCRACGAPIVWAYELDAQPSPIDWVPNITFWLDERGRRMRGTHAMHSCRQSEGTT